MNRKIDLAIPGVAAQVAAELKKDMDLFCSGYDGGHRWHLGGSQIGETCSRKLWYIFRWCFREIPETIEEYGRKQRLFNRGHREEEHFIKMLEGIGCKVYFEDTFSDPLYYSRTINLYQLESQLKEFEDDEKLLKSFEKLDTESSEYKKNVRYAKAQGVEFKQFRISAVKGHFGGSLDGIIYLPVGYGWERPILAEFKTNGTGGGFNKLCASGLALAKPMHYAQTCTYGSDVAYNFDHVLYLNINKNDDSMHVELAKLDHKLGENMRVKAERIITSDVPPPKLSENPTFKDCSYCPGKDICHNGKPSEKNCRSCAAAKPADNAEWFCTVHNGIIPRDFVKTGCDSYYSITARS